MMEKLKSYGIWFLIVLSIVILFSGLIKLVYTGEALPGPSKINETDRFKGKQDSKVVLIEYSDFQCPACAYYYPLVDKLTKEYADKIVFAYRHFPLRQIHKNSQFASQTAESAGRQNKFWEMSDLLFNNQKDWAEENNALDIFRSYAQKLNLDKNKFETDFNSDKTKDKIENDFKSGTTAGVNGTPTFYLNGNKLQNIRSYEDLKRSVEEELKK